ncbi:hypothetical protein AURDEDRAFT_170346 [Auricularia subglabra TFB-10046 SS5]|nr:hypothetical protein AURDEDRAFT_170346 [Auricularia subglabra TFB-10046 SS5]
MYIGCFRILTFEIRDDRDLTTLAYDRFVTPADQIGDRHIGWQQPTPAATQSDAQIAPIVMQTAGYQLPSLIGDNASYAQIWIHEYEKFMRQPAGTTVAREKAHKARNFPKFLLGEALEWFDDLTPAQQESWDQLMALFNVRWPKPKAAKPTHEEYIKRFRAKKLSREELEKRVHIANGGPDDTRWRITEYSEELAALASKTGSATDDLILYTYEQVPKGIEMLMREWREANGDATFDEFATRLGELSQADIKNYQSEADVAVAHAAALAAHAAQLEETKREMEALRAQVTKLTSSTPPHMTPRGRGFYGRGSYLPPYASREPSPQGQRQLDPQAPSFYPRRQSTPPPTPPAQRLSVPTTPSTPSTPPSARRRTCIRCGQPFSGTHQSMLQCLNPPLPPDEQGRQMNEYKTRTFLAGTPRTPGTPTPGPRPREVYSLDPAYDYAVQQGEHIPQFGDVDEEELALIMAEEELAGKENEAGN